MEIRKPIHSLMKYMCLFTNQGPFLGIYIKKNVIITNNE